MDGIWPLHISQPVNKWRAWATDIHFKTAIFYDELWWATYIDEMGQIWPTGLEFDICDVNTNSNKGCELNFER